MRIVVISDTHGDIYSFETAVSQQPQADIFIHLGDCESDVEAVKKVFPKKQFLSVAGNCDFGSKTPSEGEIVLCGKRIFYTHGHNYKVKFGDNAVISEARRRGADILLYGHTHVPVCMYDDGLYILNPGSLGHPRDGVPTYGIIDITKAGIVTNIAEVRG